MPRKRKNKFDNNDAQPSREPKLDNVVVAHGCSAADANIGVAQSPVDHSLVMPQYSNTLEGSGSVEGNVALQGWCVSDFKYIDFDTCLAYMLILMFITSVHTCR